jgi:hypothetical protein
VFANGDIYEIKSYDPATEDLRSLCFSRWMTRIMRSSEVETILMPSSELNLEQECFGVVSV